MSDGYELSPKDPEFAEALGRTIRVLRIERKIDRKELAHRADISYSYLSAIENGHKPPSTSTLYRLAEVLEVPGDQLLSAARERVQADTSPRPVATSYAPPPSAASPRPRRGRASWFRSEPEADEEAAPGWAAREAWSMEARSDDAAGRHGDDGPRQELLRIVARLPDEEVRRILDIARRLGRG